MEFKLANGESFNIQGGDGLKVNGQDVILQIMIETTHAELKSLRDNGMLIPGMQYRITDYVATTIQNGTISANHPFDIIVTADDERTLSESARAIRHEGDTYFPSTTKFNMWQIDYTIDNEITRFMWADGTNGKGVIHRLTDEFGNSLPFDFKGITDASGAYSINNGGYPSNRPDVDASLNGNCQNIIEEIQVTKGAGRRIHFNYFRNSCQNIRLSKWCYSNIFYNSDNIILGYSCESNEFYDSNSVTLGDKCSDNVFRNIDNGPSTPKPLMLGNNCNRNNITAGNVILGDSCNDIIIGKDSRNITIGNGCETISIGENCANISIGNGCSYISFGTTTENTYKYTRNVTVGDGVSVVAFTNLPDGESIQNVSIKSGVYSKMINVTYENKIYRDAHTVIQPSGSYTLSV